MVLTLSHIEKDVDWLRDNGSAPVKYLKPRDLLATAASSKATLDLRPDLPW